MNQSRLIPINKNATCLIFDCDGTLADSMPLHLQAWEAAIQKFGGKFDLAYINALRGMRDEDIVRKFNTDFNCQLSPVELVDWKHRYFLKHIIEVKPIEPVVGLVYKYAGEKLMAVVSGSRKESVNAILESFNIISCFETILTAEDPFPPKPEPDIFLAAARQLDVAPENCLVLEDGELGIIAAQKAGMMAMDITKHI